MNFLRDNFIQKSKSKIMKLEEWNLLTWSFVFWINQIISNRWIMNYHSKIITYEEAKLISVFSYLHTSNCLDNLYPICKQLISLVDIRLTYSQLALFSTYLIFISSTIIQIQYLHIFYCFIHNYLSSFIKLFLINFKRKYILYFLYPFRYFRTN